MLTKVGKSLVYLHLMLSLMLATIAAGICANRIDWAGKGTAGEREGVIARARAQIQHDRDLFKIARQRFDKEALALNKIEGVRSQELQWQEKQMNALLLGPANGPIQTFEYKNGRLQVDAAGRPKMIPHPDARLKPRREMVADLEKEDKELEKLILAIADQIKQEQEATALLDGKPGETKGLRALFGELQLARENSKAEADFIAPLRINRSIEAASLRRRRQELQARIAELERKIGVAARQP